METWDKLPLKHMDEFAERESFRRDVYRPPYSMHKWWARRNGSSFRAIGLAALTDESTTAQDIIDATSGGGYEGLYFQHHEEKFKNKTVLDPFAGGGTTLLETNRLGAQTIGYELNPVAWFVTKKTIDEVDVDELRSKGEEVLSDVREEIGDYFTTNDPKSGRKAEILYSFLAQRIDCLTCDETVELHSKYILRKKQKTSPAAVYCPECDSVYSLNREVTDSETCPNCNHNHNPKDGNFGYGKYTCSNGHKHDLKETLNRLEERPEFRYYALQYVDSQGNKRFKATDSEDLEKLDDVSNAVNEQEENLKIPKTTIPEGDKTTALRNYNYESFDQLFTDRQLLTFSSLLERIEKVDDQNIKEFLLLAVSNCLRYNSKLSKWQASQQKGINVFTRHAYVPLGEPVEGNPLNTNANLVSLQNCLEKVYAGKEYCQKPFEKVKNRKSGSVDPIYIQNESVKEERLSGLKCKTAERLDEEDESIDYVITDPPYYDNVQYSELSEYFYVWMRQLLADKYEEFQPEVVPKAREIVANKSANKSEEFFIESLTNVFSEANRVLKPDGEMVFTYHHNKNEAWSVILEALIESGFTVTGAYPVQSEMPTNVHIEKLDNAEYDILIFANKERSEEEITLTELRQNLFFELQDMVVEERERRDGLGQADLGVILRGKCLYYYSKHYPNVYSDGEEVGIDQALDTVDSVIEQILESSVNLPADIDPITLAYAAFQQRGFEDYDELNKHLLAKNLNVSDLEDEKLVKGPRDKKEPVTADERINYIESKLNSGSSPQQTLGNGDDGADNLLDIDKVHYLYHLYKTDQNTVEYLKEWKTSDLEDLADFMADVTGDERYERVMEMGLQQF
jgi:adenine-specific DNA methylase